MAGLAAAVVAGPAAGVDLDDPTTVPLHFAAESVSAAAATVAGSGPARATYYHVEAPPGNAELTTTAKLRLDASERWYVRADLDGMVFSATPELRTRGAGAGAGLASAAAVRGGAGETFVVYGLPRGGYARGLTFALSIGDTLAVPRGEGRYAAKLVLYDDLGEALDGVGGLSYGVFGGEKTVVAMTSGLEIGIEPGLAVADAATGYRTFAPSSASGASRDADNPSAPAVLGSIEVRHRAATSPGGETVYAARGGIPATAEAVIGSVRVVIEGDMAFATFDLRAGTADDRCLAAAGLPGGGVIALSPPAGRTAVTTAGAASVEHDPANPFGRRSLCVWLPAAGAGQTPPAIPAGYYEATVTVTPPGAAAAVEETGAVGRIARSGAWFELLHLTTSAHFEQWILIVNRGRVPAPFGFVSFQSERGVVAALTPEAAARSDAGLDEVPAGGLVALRVAETLRIEGRSAAGGAPSTAATLAVVADADDIDVATVATGPDGSTDTAVYAGRRSVEPVDVR